MSKQIFTTKEKIIGILILIILGFSFFWYSLRPYINKQKCLKQAEKYSRSSSQTFEQSYDFCLLKNGLK